MGAFDPGIKLAALQHSGGTIPAVGRHLWSESLPWTPIRPASSRMIPPKPGELFVQGITSDGKPFRPSDWAERLAGAMSCFRPEGSPGGIAAYIGYSPYCVPRVINGVKCVIVSESLRDVEPMAWDFVMNFARDNQLQVAHACLLPDATKAA